MHLVILTILGKGAGGFPTASAVVGDILTIGKTILNPVSRIQNCTCYLDLPIKTIKEVETPLLYQNDCSG